MEDKRKQQLFNRAAGREIPRGEWLSFLDGFSRKHQGRLVTVEVSQGTGKKRVEAENLTFEGVTSEHSEDHDRISIAVGKAPDDHLTHFVSDPMRVLLMETEAGGQVGLQIEAADGVRTVVRFPDCATPERLSDIAA
jgi:hypothetical protein